MKGYIIWVLNNKNTVSVIFLSSTESTEQAITTINDRILSESRSPNETWTNYSFNFQGPILLEFSVLNKKEIMDSSCGMLNIPKNGKVWRKWKYEKIQENYILKFFEGEKMQLCIKKYI